MLLVILQIAFFRPW